MNQNQNNGFNNSIQFNNLMMQYMMMNAYQRNMMHNALMMSNRNLVMGFNQPYTLNNVSKNNQKKQAQTQVHCPFCNSTNVNKISGTKKAMSIIGWGIFSNKVGKQWHCNNCKSDF